MTSRHFIKNAIVYSQRAPSNAILAESVSHGESFLPYECFSHDLSTDNFSIHNAPHSLAVLDAIEWIIIHAINSHLMYSSKIIESFITCGLDQLRTLQDYHCSLVKYCWKKNIPLWVRDRRAVNKEYGKLQYTTEQNSETNIDKLWRDSITCFKAEEEDPYAKSFVASFALHSWLAKVISRPKGRYLIEKVAANAKKYGKYIGITNADEFGVSYFSSQDCLYQPRKKEKIFFKRYTAGQVDTISLYIPKYEKYNEYISEIFLTTIVGMQLKLYYTPIPLIFLHELQHMKTLLKNVSRELFPMDPSSAELWSNQEEWYTIAGSATCENVMHTEYRSPTRSAHKGYTLDEFAQFFFESKTINLKNLHNNLHLAETLPPPPPFLSI